MAELLEAAMRFRDALHQGWCQGDWARDAAGRIVDYDSDKAKSFCLYGAIALTALSYPGTEEKLEKLIHKEAGNVFIAPWNDDPDRTYAEILALADNVVRRAKELEESA